MHSINLFLNNTKQAPIVIKSIDIILVLCLNKIEITSQTLDLLGMLPLHQFLLKAQKRLKQYQIKCGIGRKMTFKTFLNEL